MPTLPPAPSLVSFKSNTDMRVHRDAVRQGLHGGCCGLEHRPDVDRKLRRVLLRAGPRVLRVLPRLGLVQLLQDRLHHLHGRALRLRDHRHQHAGTTARGGSGRKITCNHVVLRLIPTLPVLFTAGPHHAPHACSYRSAPDGKNCTSPIPLSLGNNSFTNTITNVDIEAAGTGCGFTGFTKINQANLYSFTPATTG